ncbi:hypothetical protein AH03_61 [Erwinia phage AH03]|uniref:Uncharacterized protein n=1 Tax=Erwinia phage AH03 TaxID=2869568 RepID=A0AAE7X0C9_9CAUD|nr:hypothetical protein AH03_61 [Erwinia phage AH03]
MAQLQQAFDASNVDPSQGIGQLPVGSKLPVTIVDSEIKGTKDGANGYIQYTLQVGAGEHAGKKGAYRLHMYHSSEQTRQIAEKQQSALCHVTGVFKLQDTQQLHNIPFMVDVVAQQDPKYTEVKAVYDANGNEPGRAHSQQASQPQSQPQQKQQPAITGGWGNGQQQTQQQSQPEPQQQTQQAPANPGWGQQTQQPQQQEQQPQNTGGGWNQGATNGSPAPWGQK